MIRSKTMYGAMLVTAALAASAQNATAQVQQRGAVTTFTAQQSSQAAIDFVNAKPMMLPDNPVQIDAVQSTINALTSAPSTVVGGAAPGAVGNGAVNPVNLGAPAVTEPDGVGSQEWGTANLPFSTARADLTGPTNQAYPYRASGKLFFNISGSTYVCSASLIKRGVVVTAAHCVAAFGQSRFYSNWQFVPGYRNGSAPFGVWTAASATVMTSYYNGTDTCSVSGVVCANDVAVLVLNSQSGGYPGTSTGWYGYGWNGWGFVNNTTHLTQIGYPVCLNNGLFMERNDAQGVKNASFTNNTTYGSLMCGGSSGGPLVANFGIRPALTGTTAGSAPNPNVVIGVTSWGYTSSAVKQQGASPFTSGNITVLVNTVCSGSPAYCI